ncbi:hypothetical protein EW053_24950 [Streptomyces sp. IB2014 016-6]|nr:hypothetical protein EW053_24950 [Streptomyces sp. IB2014 016-6]
MITAHRRPSSLPTAPIGIKRAGRGLCGLTTRSFIYFWPVFTGQTIPVGEWQDRMWFDTWV